MSDHGVFSSYEGLHGAANVQDSWGLFMDVQGFGRMDAGSVPTSPAQRLHHGGPRYFNFPYFCTMCGLEKLELEIKTDWSVIFPLCCLERWPWVGDNKSESIEVALDME